MFQENNWRIYPQAGYWQLVPLWKLTVVAPISRSNWAQTLSFAVQLRHFTPEVIDRPRSAVNAEPAVSLNQYHYASHNRLLIVVSTSIRVWRGSQDCAYMGGIQVQPPGL